MRTEPSHRSKDALAADRGCFHGLAAFHEDDKRDHPGQRKVDFVDLAVGIAEHSALYERDNDEPRPQIIESGPRK